MAKKSELVHVHETVVKPQPLPCTNNVINDSWEIVSENDIIEVRECGYGTTIAGQSIFKYILNVNVPYSADEVKRVLRFAQYIVEQHNEYIKKTRNRSV